MSTYVLPQVLVFQEFTVVPSAAAHVLPAHISGPNAELIRYAETSERANGKLGFYDRLLDTDYNWPNKPAGGVADASYTKLWIQNALLQYFQDTVSQGSVITKLDGFNNRIHSATKTFKTSTTRDGTEYPRHSSLLDRDVKTGDIAKVRGVNGTGDSITLWTYVKGIHGDTIDSTIGEVENDASNAATQGASASISQTAGPLNCVTTTVDAALYDGLESGNINDTYEIIVTQSSVNADHTTAELRVISGSGNDDVLAVTPSAAGVATAIGTRGLTVTFDYTSTAGCSASATADDVSPDDLIVGQRFLVTVHQAFTAPTVTSGGTYDSDKDTTYIIEITRGGSIDSTVFAQFKVTTTNGIDLSGPTTVTDDSLTYDVGTASVTVQFSTLELRKGDKYYVTVVGTQEGPMRVIELGHNLSTSIAAGSEVDLTLFILKPVLEISKDRVGFAPQLNWDTTSTAITAKSGIIAYDETWTDSGVLQPLDVYSESSKQYGILYVETRYWLQDLVGKVLDISDAATINAIPGPLHPDNPLKWGVFKALENSNGTAVKYTAVSDPDSDDAWATVLQKVLGRDDIYSLVPLTRRRTVLDLYAAHVNAESTPEEGLWRVLWVNLEGVPEIPLVAAGSSVTGHTAATTSDGLVALAVIEDDPDTAGSQYTQLRVTSGNAELLQLGVKSGDIVRCLYTSDGFGNEEYSEFVISEVVNEDQLLLLTGPAAPISVAAKIEIWRTLDATAEAAQIATNAGSWANRRVRATWPDTISSGGTSMAGYFLNCALAGLSSGILPHQGMTNLEIAGFDDVSRTSLKFNRSQLGVMAVSGTWIVTQNIASTSVALGQVYTRHAVTTASYDDINQREEMITRNVDSISYRFKEEFRPFIGVTNVTPVIEGRINVAIGNLIRLLQTELSTTNLGGQLIDGTIVFFGPSLVFKDRYVVKLSLNVPYALNNFELHLAI